MKTLYLLITVLILTIFGSCTAETQEAQHPLVGTWELESARYTTPDTTMNVSGEERNQIKMFTNTHYAWIAQAPERTEFTEPGGTDAEFIAAARAFGAGAGTYTLKGDSIFIEHVDYFLIPNWIGASFEFTYEMDGNDRWIQRGTLPTSSLGMDEYDTELYEVWTRVE